MITCVVVNSDGTVLVFDESGRRIPEYCGQWNEKKEAIVRDAPYDAGWHGVNPDRCSVCRKVIEGCFHRHMASEGHARNVQAKGAGQRTRHASEAAHLREA